MIQVNIVRGIHCVTRRDFGRSPHDYGRARLAEAGKVCDLDGYLLRNAGLALPVPFGVASFRSGHGLGPVGRVDCGGCNN